jgi:hypothetical protein
MLQIASGKFFATDKCYETPRKGTFFTNYRMAADDSIQTPIGNVVSSGDVPTPASLTYEITEKIEWQEPAPGVMTATGGTELVDDYSAVLAFALNVVCTTDEEAFRRLTVRGAVSSRPSKDPSKYLRRAFNPEVPARSEDAAFVANFFKALIALRRDSYDGAMRAIRRYVTATHRIVDDTSLAYALFVMAIEALAQTADASVAAWPDYDESKRRRIDEALEGMSDEAAGRVRAAVLANEHVALARRFRDFVTQHLTADFFRREAAESIAPVSRLDLAMLLKRAYDIRSGYVHRLQPIPKLIAGGFGHAETFLIDGKPALTFEGLARIARHVIMQFVHRSPKVDREAFNWHAELPNLIQMQWAPQYWIGNPDGYTPAMATMWLQNFLTQISPIALGVPPTLTDLTLILEKIESLRLETVKASHRRPMLALYHLFILAAGEKYQREMHVDLMTRYGGDFDDPTLESLAMYLVTSHEFPWSLDALEALHTSYVRRRWHKDTLMLGATLEAVFMLRLAERNRQSGNEARSRELISLAVEAFPGPSLLAFERGLQNHKLDPIDWRKALLPENAQDQLPKEG